MDRSRPPEAGSPENKLPHRMRTRRKGCEACQFTGYHGRQGIYEFLVVTDEIRNMIIDRSAAGQIRAKAIKQGMKTLRQDGWGKVKQGLTTASEVIRVTQEEVIGD